jgi:membrane glycosyltransferase
MLRLACGMRPGWTQQNRSERSVTWGEAVRLLWQQTLLGALAFAGFATAGWTATLWALPLAGGLLAAIPLCVLTADPRFGRWLRERQIAAIPEEVGVRGWRPVSAHHETALALLPQPEPD